MSEEKGVCVKKSLSHPSLCMSASHHEDLHTAGEKKNKLKTLHETMKGGENEKTKTRQDLHELKHNEPRTLLDGDTNKRHKILMCQVKHDLSLLQKLAL